MLPALRRSKQQWLVNIPNRVQQQKGCLGNELIYLEKQQTLCQHKSNHKCSTLQNGIGMNKNPIHCNWWNVKLK